MPNYTAFAKDFENCSCGKLDFEADTDKQAASVMRKWGAGIAKACYTELFNADIAKTE